MKQQEAAVSFLLHTDILQDLSGAQIETKDKVLHMSYKDIKDSSSSSF